MGQKRIIAYSMFRKFAYILKLMVDEIYSKKFVFNRLPNWISTQVNSMLSHLIVFFF